MSQKIDTAKFLDSHFQSGTFYQDMFATKVAEADSRSHVQTLGPAGRCAFCGRKADKCSGEPR